MADAGTIAAVLVAVIAAAGSVYGYVANRNLTAAQASKTGVEAEALSVTVAQEIIEMVRGALAECRDELQEHKVAMQEHESRIAMLTARLEEAQRRFLDHE